MALNLKSRGRSQLLSALFVLGVMISRNALGTEFVTENAQTGVGGGRLTSAYTAQLGTVVAFQDGAAGGPIRLLKKTGDGWLTETIDAAATGWPIRMVSGTDGTLFVAYCTLPGIKLAVRTPAGVWSSTTVTGATGNIFNLNIALVSGRPAICYSNGTGLFYVERNANATWQAVVTLDAASNSNFHAIATDLADRPHVLWRRVTNGVTDAMMFSVRTGTTWAAAQTIASASTASAFDWFTNVSMATNSNGVPAIAYVTHVGSGFVRQVGFRQATAAGNAYTWGAEQIINVQLNAAAISSVSSALRLRFHGQTDMPQIAVEALSGTSPAAIFLSKPSTTWVSEVLATGLSEPFDMSLSLDGYNNPAVLYRNVASGSVVSADAGIRVYSPNAGEFVLPGANAHVVFRAKGNLSFETSDDNGSTWSYGGLFFGGPNGLTAANLPIPSFYRSAEVRLRIRRDAPEPSPGTDMTPAFVSFASSACVTSSVLDANPAAGTPFHMSFGPGASPNVTYSDGAGGGKLATSRGCPFTITPLVSGAGPSGTQTVEIAGVLHLVFRNGTGQVLHSVRTGGVWSAPIVVVSTTGNRDVRLAATAAGNLVIAVVTSTGQIVAYYRTAGVWSTSPELAASVDASTFAVALGLDTSGNAHVAFTSSSSQVLNYTYKANGVWQPIQVIQLLQSPSAQMFQIRLAVDPSNDSHVAYYEYKSGGTTVRVVDRTGGILTGVWGAKRTISNGSSSQSPLPLSIVATPQSTVWVGYQTHGLFQVYGPYTSSNPISTQKVIAVLAPTQVHMTATPAGSYRMLYEDNITGLLMIGTPCGADELAPGAITNLGVQFGQTTAVMSFTAPGDDDQCGGAALSYDVRYSISPINSESAWTAATLLGFPTSPLAPGSPECANLGLSEFTCGTRYYFTARAVDEAGNLSPLGNVASRIPCQSSLEFSCGSNLLTQLEDEAPRVLRMLAPLPNPASDGVSFAFDVPRANEGDRLSMKVYDVLGREVYSTMRPLSAAGRLVIAWDRLDSRGSRLGRGVYFAQMRVGLVTQRRTIVLK